MASITFPAPTQLKNLLDPTDTTDAATKEYVDNSFNAITNLSVANLTSTNKITANVIVANSVSGNGSQLSNITGANINGSVANANYANYAGTAFSVSVANVVGIGNIATLNLTGSSTDILYGNGTFAPILAANANYANYAGNVVNSSQPNITSVGTLTSLAVTGNITAGNVAGGNLVSANYISGNGSLLTAITGANVMGFVPNANVSNTAYAVSGSNVTGQVGNALIAGTVYTAAQPNITSVGTLSNLSVTNDVIISTGNLDLTAGDVWANSGTVKATYLQGTLVAASNYQPNITGLGTLGNLNVTGNTSTGNLIVTGNTTIGGNISGVNYMSANYFVGNGSLLNGLSTLTSTVDTFTGDGSSVNFNLSTTPSGVNYTLVAVGGILQPRSYYSVSGGSITFSTAPPSTAPIEVTTIGGSVQNPSSTNILWNIISANTTLAAGNGYFIDTTSSAITVTLPSSPTLGQTIKIDDLAGKFATNNLTIAGGGSKIQGSASNWVASTNQENFTLVYSNGTYGWKVLA